MSLQHIIVPALHKNRFEIRDLFRETMDLPALTEEPTDLTALRAPICESVSCG